MIAGVGMAADEHGLGSVSLVMILVKENTPAPDALGAANGISEFLQMVAGGIGSTFIRSVDPFFLA